MFSHVQFTGSTRATVYRRSLLDLLLNRAGDDRRVYMREDGRWFDDASGRWVGVRVQYAIERARLRWATAPPS